MRAILSWTTIITILLAGWAPSAAAPSLASLSPASVAAGSPAWVLTVNGASFENNSTVRWAGADRPTTFISSTRLSAAIAAADVASGGPYSVTVFTPGPGGGLANPLPVTLYARITNDDAADALFGQPRFDAADADNADLPAANQLDYPFVTTSDPATGRLFVVDANNHRVLSWANAAALANSQAADLVLGQPNFTAIASNRGVTVSADSLNLPLDAALDGAGNLFVVDHLNHRVLEYLAPLSSGMAASRVFGQADFTHRLPNRGGTVAANTLSHPNGVALDALGNLYVADTGNQRVLEYDAPLSSGMAASRVLGQADFTHNAANAGGAVSASSLQAPTDLAVDGQGHLMVADWGNQRVLEFATPLSSGQAASLVLGQTDFTHSAADRGGPVSAGGLDGPVGVALNAQGWLFVVDQNNERVLAYRPALSNGMDASRVFGQGGSFTSSDVNHGGLSRASLNYPSGAGLDGAGRLYVADAENGRVLVFDLALGPGLYLTRLPLVRR